MDDNNYKMDKLQLVEHQQQIATEALIDIEKRSEIEPISFLKENYNNKKIRDRVNDVGFKMMLAISVTRICAYSGIKSPVSNFDADDIIKMILSTYKDLSIEEIYKAFEMERYGNYEDKTEHFGLFNADYVATILKKYKKWKQTTKMQHNISPPLSIPVITNSQKEEILLNGIIRVFDEYKNTGVMPEPNNYIFDELYERKIIPDGDTPEIQMYYQKKYTHASEEIQIELKSYSPVNKTENRTIQSELQKIIDNNSDKVAARVKKIILSEWFTKLINNNKHISEYLNK